MIKIQAPDQILLQFGNLKNYCIKIYSKLLVLMLNATTYLHDHLHTTIPYPKSIYGYWWNSSYWVETIKKEISPVFAAHFVNLCLRKGEYPDLLKKIYHYRPIFIESIHSEYGNYRQITTLSILNKIIEKVVMGQVSEFLENNNCLLSDAQQGFRRGRSIGTILSRFSEDQ